MRSTYLDGLDLRTPVDSVGRAVVGTPGAERQLNISPAVSPDGRYVAFISRRDLFNTNLYVADAETGEIVSELESTKSNPHFDALRFINSAGSWSPDGRTFAFVTFVEGDNEINTFDVESGDVKERIAVEGIGAIQNLAWSPDGRYVAFAGLDGGVSDLYVLDLKTRTVKQVTNDRYADLQPAWSPDGKTLAFTTDRGPGGTNLQNLEFGEYGIGFVELESRKITSMRPLPGGMHHNPQYSPDGRSVYFISDHDGFKDVYRYHFDEEQVYRVTSVQTGVSGITSLSPAMSVASQSGRMMFSVFSNSSYAIVSLESDETQGVPMTNVDASSDPLATGRLLPPTQDASEGLVGSYLSDPSTGLPPPQNFEAAEASNRLRLDRISPPTIAGGYSGAYGTQIYGGVAFYFSDMLGNQNLTTFVQANGTIRDIGGGGFYSNRKNRWNWGVGGFHIPTLYGGYVPLDQNNDGIADGALQVIRRVYQTSGGGQISYPLSQTRRFEITPNAVRYGFGIEAFVFDGRGRTEVDPAEIGLDLTLPDPLYLGQVGFAFVSDFSNFGFTSPTQGGRYRYQVTPNFGSKNFAQVLLDYRRYFFFNPVTLAFRGMHVGNYGTSVDNLNDGEFEDLFVRETLGDPYRLGFVRGYSFNSLFSEDACQIGNQCNVDRLYGTRIALASAELRVPLFGNDAFGLVNLPFLPTELSVFTDAGIAWTNEDLRDFSFDTSTPFDNAVGSGVVPARPVVSSGVSARINLLGAAIFEIFYASTFQRQQDWDFGLILRPGW